MTDEPQHFLVITDLGPDGIDWEVEHPASCPKEIVSAFLEEGSHEEFTCNVARMLTDAGADAIAGGIPAPGRYPLSFESSHTPPTPNGPAEWDAWLEVGDPVE